MAAALLSRCSFAVRTAQPAEVQAAARCLAANGVQSSSLTVFPNTSALPARGICRSYATKKGVIDYIDHSEPNTLGGAIKAEIDFERDNPTAIEVCQK